MKIEVVYNRGRQVLALNEEIVLVYIPLTKEEQEALGIAYIDGLALRVQK